MALTGTGEDRARRLCTRELEEIIRWPGCLVLATINAIVFLDEGPVG